MDQQPTQQPQFKQPTVLLVEDAQFIAELYTRALSKAGFVVETADDGQKALDIAMKESFDVILLDIMLPTMNGVDMLYRMKDPGVTPPITSKIIITTNLDQPEEARIKIDKLADGYLIKAEITPKELVSYVKQVLGT